MSMSGGARFVLSPVCVEITKPFITRRDANGSKVFVIIKFNINK